MDKYRLAEPLFYSIQGEGYHTGMAAIFVRFSGCNIACTQNKHGFICDTNYQTHVFIGKRDLAAEIVRMVSITHCKAVIFTGGEPMLQLDGELIDLLPKDIKIHIETNGVLPMTSYLLFERAAWVAVSPKDGHPAVIKGAHELRLVVDTEERFKRLVDQNWSLYLERCSQKYLSPVWGSEESLQTCIRLVKEHPEWRLSLQTHKYIKIP